MKVFSLQNLVAVTDFLNDIGRVLIVDIGAQSLDHEAHIYQPLLDNGGSVEVDVIGFEPVDAARRKRVAEENVKLLPYVVGNGESTNFNTTRYSALSSIYTPNRELRGRFIGGHDMYEVVEKSEVPTTRLDDLEGVQECDYLKIDTQGGEKLILDGASNLLKTVTVIHLEGFFIPFYEDMPLWKDSDAILQEAGFELIDIFPRGRRLCAFGDHKDQMFESNLHEPSRLVWADFLYVKEPAAASELSFEKQKKMAFVLDLIYRKYDLVAEVLTRIDQQYGHDFLRDYVKDGDLLTSACGK